MDSDINKRLKDVPSGIKQVRERWGDYHTTVKKDINKNYLSCIYVYFFLVDIGEEGWIISSSHDG